MGLSSFYNFKVENGWEDSHDFKSRVGALEEFQSEYHFRAYVSDERVEEYDFTARFNALDELEAHYHFFAQSLEYDAEYHFTGQIAPLEMVIEYEEEATLKVVVREVDIQKIDTAIINNKVNITLDKSFKNTNEEHAHNAVLERTESLGSAVECELELESTKSLELATECSVHLDAHIALDSERVHEVSKENTFEPFSEHKVDIELAKVESANVDNKINIIIDESGIGHVEKENIVVVDSIENAETPIDKSANIEKIERFELIHERLTDLEEQIIGKADAIETDVEKTIKGSVETLRLSDLEHQNNGDMVDIFENINTETSIYSYSDAIHVADVELSRKSESDQSHVADLEGVVEAIKDSTASVEMELHEKSKVTTEYLTSVENELKVKIDAIHPVELDQFANAANETIYNAKTESSKTSEMKHITHATIDNEIQGNKETSLEVNVEKTVSANEEDTLTVDFEGDIQLDRVEITNVELEDSITGKADAMETYVERDIKATTQTEYMAEAEKTILSTTELIQFTQIEKTITSDKRNIVAGATIESIYTAESERQLKAEIDNSFTGGFGTIHNLEIEDVMTATEWREFVANVEGIFKGVIDVLLDIEIESPMNQGTLAAFEAEVEHSFTADEKLGVDSKIEEITYADLIQERLTELENYIEADKLREYMTDIEDMLEGNKVEKDKDKLIWLIMGRPSWIHQYWQRTTR